MKIVSMRAPGVAWARALPLLLLAQAPACTGVGDEREGDRGGDPVAGLGDEGGGGMPAALLGWGQVEAAEEDEVIDPQEHATDLPVPTGTEMSPPAYPWLTQLIADARAAGGDPVLVFDDGRAGEWLNVRVVVRPEHVMKDETGGLVADVELGALTLRLAHEAAEELSQPQLVLPATLPLDQAIVLKTYRRPRVGGALGPVELAMVSVFDRRAEGAGPAASLDLAALGGVSLAFDCDAVAYEIAKEVPPVAVSFPKLSGCTLLECGKAKAAWLRANHDLYRFRQMLDYIASWPEKERAFLWQQEAANKDGVALHSHEDDEVGPNTAPAYFFGSYSSYRFDAIRWAYRQIWEDFHDHDLQGLELDIECTPEAVGDLCNTHKPAGHHAVKSNVKLCDKAFHSAFEVFDVPRLVIHETMHHLYVPWDNGTPRLSPLQDTHTHGHAATCLGGMTTDKGYGLSGLRHLSTYLNKGGGDCYHRDFTFRNNDTYAYAAATIGTYLRFGLIRSWPLHLPPKPDDNGSAPLECGLIGVDTPPPGFVDPFSKCQKIGGELVCPGVGGGGGIELEDLDLAILCPED